MLSYDSHHTPRIVLTGKEALDRKVMHEKRCACNGLVARRLRSRPFATASNTSKKSVPGLST
jgi:hypothetical protein